MDYQKIFDTAKLLFEYFGWYSALLVLGTTLLMIPINILYKKIMNKDSLERLRKTVSCFSVYLIACGLIALFTHFVVKAPLTFEYLLTASTSCGLLAMLLWAVIKFVRDYGIMPIINSIANSKQAKQWLKDLGIPETLVSLVKTNVNKYMKDTNICSFDDYIKNETLIINQVRTQITGFVANENINEVIKKITQSIKSEFEKKQTKSAGK